MSVQDAALLQTAVRALNANRLSQAKTICDELLQRNPRNARALDIRGRVAFAYGFYEEAVEYLGKCTTIEPRDPNAHLMLAQVHATQGHFKQALSRYDRALRLVVREPRAIAGKADVLQQSGEVEKAAALLEPFVSAGEESPEMAVVMARIHVRARRWDDAIALLTRHMDAPDAAGYTLQHLHTLMGKALEGRGDNDEAFAAYTSANRVMPSHFDAAAWTAHSAALIEAFSAEQLAALPRAGGRTDQPVFIVGMPRSGSTLIEAIIDAHPAARGIGEFSAMQEIVNGIGLVIGLVLPYPACVGDLEQADLEELSSRYLERARRVDRTAERLADKYLMNYRHLGLIALLFPQARVIHSRRDPLDTCISCYMEPLSAIAHPYAADLADLGTVYRDYERLMSHWRQVLEIEWLDVEYEALVADQEAESRRIIEFLGLPWDEHCLRYFESSRTFHTLSYDQVRRPVYRTSVRRAERFKAHLEPLRSTLAKEDQAR